MCVTCVLEKPLILSLVFLGVGNFDVRYFFGSKISCLCIFLGLQYEAPSDLLPIKYTSRTPPPWAPKLMSYYSSMCMNFLDLPLCQKNKVKDKSASQVELIPVSVTLSNSGYFYSPLPPGWDARPLQISWVKRGTERLTLHT